jgi:catechol 2,3-dioxygenase-like lactoylglutathione lyase family enzyme
MHHTPQSSQRARQIEVWAVLRTLGRRGLAELVVRACDAAAAIAERLRDGGLTVLNDVVLNQVLVRLVDGPTTERLITEIQADGRVWCGPTQWDGATAMRISVSSWKTDLDDAAFAADAILDCAAQVERRRADRGHAGGMADLMGVHHVALTVRDLEASARWYGEVLGCEELFREDGEGRRASVMRFAGGGHGVALVEHGDSAGVPFDPRRTGLDHVAFTVGTYLHIEEWAARLSAAGVDHSGVIDIPPGAILNFKDPDGIGLALFWERA